MNGLSCDPVKLYSQDQMVGAPIWPAHCSLLTPELGWLVPDITLVTVTCLSWLSWFTCPNIDLVMLKGTYISCVRERIFLYPPGHESGAWSPRCHHSPAATRRGTSLRMECRVRSAEERDGNCLGSWWNYQKHKALGPGPTIILSRPHTFPYWVSPLESDFLLLDSKSIRTSSRFR